VTFEQYVKVLGIESDRLYTYKEIAQLLDKEATTIRSWCNLGIRTRRWGIVSLENFRRGREAVIHGRCLVEFLRKIQANN